MPTLRIVLVTIAVLVTLAALLVLLGKVLAQTKARSMAEAMLGAVKGEPRAIITEADLAPLPEPVRRWLRWSNVVGRERPRTVRLLQKGELRQSASKGWMPFEAEQYYTTDPPAFLWYANVSSGIIPQMQGRDTYLDGRGNMLIKIGGWIVVADGKGPEFDQGSLLRYLSEIIWFPAAALESYITWTAVDANSARATMSYGGVTGSALFIFDEEGKPTGMLAERYYSGGEGTSLEPWSTPSYSYGELKGMRIPTRGEAIWKLKSGDLPYIRLDIIDVEYDVPRTY